MNFSKKYKKNLLLLTILFLCSFMTTLLRCSFSDSIQEYSTWTFSGYVLDGYTDEALSGVSVYFLDKDGVENEATTGESGGFLIKDLPFGEKSFRFAYSTSGLQSSEYTERVVTVAGFSESSSLEGDIGDVSRIIKLFPLTGGLSGKVIVKLLGSELTVPAKNTVVKVTFQDTALKNSTPSVFETTTNSTGLFSFIDLPVASGVTIGIPNLIIDDIAYSLGPINPPQLFSGKIITMATLFMFAADSTDWPVNLVTSNVLSNDGFGLTGVPVDITPRYVLATTPDSSSIEAVISGGGDPEAVVTVRGDTVVIDPIRSFTYNALVSIIISGKDITGKNIRLDFGGIKQFRTERGVFPLASNTWDASGQQVSEFEFYDTMWVKFSENLDSNSNTIEWFESLAKVDIFGSGSKANAEFWINEDTLFVKPDHRMTAEFGDTIGFNIVVQAQSGKRSNPLDFTVELISEHLILPLASNTWDSLEQPVSEFELYDTMWVLFSDTLDSNVNKIEWMESEADNDVFGNGLETNAAVWINGDTLFVKPDQRLAVNFGESVGFKIIVIARDGKRSQPFDFMVELIKNDYYIKWTNTKDQFGNIRDDFGVMDPVLILSSIPIDNITAVSPGSGVSSPPDLTLNNISVSGDTIKYQPTLHLNPNTTYGMHFNITFQNGIKQSNIFEVTWKTMQGVRILNTNNKQVGNFRKFNAVGDSLLVTFSKAIDTSSNAPVRFKVHITDVKGVPVRTTTNWDTSRTKAAILYLDTLPTADFDASPAYTIGAINTRAVNSITFDLATVDGEQAFNLGMGNEHIELHSEKGICAINTNIISNHDPLLEIDVDETPSNSFPLDGAIQITFSRALDTTLMNIYGSATYAGIEEKTSGLKLPCTVTFSSNAMKLIITPDALLRVGKAYYVWIKDVPGLNIAGAAAINKHGGIYSGKASYYKFLNTAFTTESPNISALPSQLQPDSNTTANVADNRLGVSAGFNYSYSVGVANTNTESSVKFQIVEAAWNANHSDSVHGYQVQVQKIERRGTTTDWYDLGTTIPSIDWTPLNAATGRIRDAEINIKTASFYNAFLTLDGDGTGNYYINNSSLFNDSSQIGIRIRAYVGEGDQMQSEVGTWSTPLVFTDNVAPCDSDFVTAANCDNLTRGGVQISSIVDFDNAAGTVPNSDGYIDLTFPEDMDPNGTAPAISFYYGPFGGANPPAELSTVAPGGGKTGWISARRYRIYVIVPVFDYTFALSDDGAFYSISVAGCRDASGMIIQTYGTDGALASSDINAAGRNKRLDAAPGQTQGSASVVSGFIRCN